MATLHEKTDPGWLERALANLDDVLLDHAHCEKKAASTALSLIFRYPQHASLMVPLSELAREELRHFEEVLGHIEARGCSFRRQRPSPYAGELMEAVRKKEPEKLLDTLLCCALIEARSCERMGLLADTLEPGPLQKLYRGLLASEARHYRSYVDLAEGLFDAKDVAARLDELARHEADVIANAPPIPRMHT